MSDANQMNSLVEEIRRRVLLELQKSGASSAAPLASLSTPALRDQPCPDGPSEHCSACGLCSVRRPEAVRALLTEGASRVGSAQGTGQAPGDIAQLIDHTLLKADATSDDVRKLCDEARRYRFASVCVNTSFVPLSRRLLAGSGVMVCAVVGFPLGAMATAAKAFEAREAVRAGAEEIDMVINQGALKSRDYALVHDDIRKVVEAARPARVKVILETGALSEEEKVIGITLSKVAGAHFVKTSTGFGPGGATAQDIALMRRLVGPDMGVKASGGVRTCEDAEKMRAAGASRIGASASVAITVGCQNKGADAGAANSSKSRSEKPTFGRPFSTKNQPAPGKNPAKESAAPKPGQY
jgi:deoxyribose-phosphate aldolase